MPCTRETSQWMHGSRWRERARGSRPCALTALVWGARSRTSRRREVRACAVRPNRTCICTLSYVAMWRFMIGIVAKVRTALGRLYGNWCVPDISNTALHKRNSKRDGIGKTIYAKL